MWTPQIILCIATACYMAEGTPQETEAACRAHAMYVMLPVIRQTAPEAVIREARCQRPGVDV